MGKVDEPQLAMARLALVARGSARPFARVRRLPQGNRRKGLGRLDRGGRGGRPRRRGDHRSQHGRSHLRDTVGRRGPAGRPDPLPGTEITAADGVHLLLLLDPARGEEHVADLLSRVGIPVDERGTEDARSALGLEQILEELGGDALILGPHVNGPKGLLTAHDGRQRLAVLGDPRLAAVEVDPGREVDESWLDGSKPEVARTISQVWSSDAHGPDELGRRFTWAKMTRPNLEGLRLALMDGADSLKPATRADPGDPNGRRGELLIESVTVADARFMGRREPMTVRFNPWLNAIIGGRGTGKSTLVDFCRKTLRRDGELGERARGEAHGEEGSLRRLFDRRVPDAATPGREGLLTADTRIEVVYRKRAERFALSWSPSGGASSIDRLTADPHRKPLRDRAFLG